MKVAHVISTFPPYKGGMGNSVYHAALQIGKRGHESVVFTTAYPGMKPGTEMIGENTSVVRLRPLLALGNAAILPQLLWRLRGFDIIHIHYPFYGTADIVVLGKLLFSKSKLVLHYHMDTVGTGLKGFIFSIYQFFFLPVIVRLASMVSCASLDYIRQSALADYFANHKKSFIEVPFGVDAKYFFPGAYPRKPIVLFVGGLDTAHYFKGVDQLINAFAKISQKYDDARLLLLGKGDLEKSYTELARSKNIADKMTIINSATDDELAENYRQARVVVLPSVNKSEAFGLVLLEAMSSATPVIASNLPGVRNVFRNLEHGFLVPPGNVNVLAAKLALLIESPKLAEEMGLAARKWIEERYSWEKVGERLEAAYLRIVYSIPLEVQP